MWGSVSRQRIAYAWSDRGVDRQTSAKLGRSAAPPEIYTKSLHYRYIAEELDDLEREIICKRYGIADADGSICKPMTQREIAKQMRISRSYISRIEERALTKLNKRFNEGGS